MNETKNALPRLNAAGCVAAIALVFAPIVQIVLAGHRSWPYWLWFFGGLVAFAALERLIDLD